ncbi:hypothetical protein EVB61_278 [Rhizobium phage RHph_TM21B]|nr:hypothetical protein EVB61_278 [Rhizobium phage RHph_TM21B]
MVKFKSDLDRSLFCTEMERIDLIGQDTIPDDLHEIFLKNRKTLVSKVKDFRRSQIGKASWRRHDSRGFRTRRVIFSIRVTGCQ